VPLHDLKIWVWCAVGIQPVSLHETVKSEHSLRLKEKVYEESKLFGRISSKYYV
jgi:hypothetical protein